MDYVWLSNLKMRFPSLQNNCALLACTLTSGSLTYSANIQYVLILGSNFKFNVELLEPKSAILSTHVPSPAVL